MQTFCRFLIRRLFHISSITCFHNGSILQNSEIGKHLNHLNLFHIKINLDESFHKIFKSFTKQVVSKWVFRKKKMIEIKKLKFPIIDCNEWNYTWFCLFFIDHIFFSLICVQCHVLYIHSWVVNFQFKFKNRVRSNPCIPLIVFFKSMDKLEAFYG